MPTLAQRLRTETRELHTAAERSRFMGRLLRGRMTRDGYGALLRNLHAVYAALEPALARHRDHPVIAPISIDALWRTSRLADDLTVRHGAAWPSRFELQPAAATYVTRLTELDVTQPQRLFAHAYVRYLGDLSGGQTLRRIVDDSLPMPDGAATAFYDFGNKTETQGLTQAFRAGLVRIGEQIDPTTEDAIVDEAKLAFALHQRLFDELADAGGLPADPSE